jgi:hypothetical protein
MIREPHRSALNFLRPAPRFFSEPKTGTLSAFDLDTAPIFQ